MVLTPIDVQQKTFATAMRGYDLDEVDDFLDNVVIALKDYEQRLRDAQERITTLESDLSKRSDEESAISRALVAAQRSADSLVEDAREEAQRILAEAETQASELEGERDEQRRVLQEEIDAIHSRLERLRAGVATMLTTVSAELDDIDEFVGDQAEAPLEAPVRATFDAAAEGAAEIEGEEAAGAHVEETAFEVETVSEKIVIDGTDEFEDDEPAEGSASPWGSIDADEDADATSDAEYDRSPDLHEITDRIDAAFGDIDEDDEESQGWGDQEDDTEGMHVRPWED